LLGESSEKNSVKEILKDKAKNKGSFSSDGSFESFGSMDENDAVIIVNPNCYTCKKEDVEDGRTLDAIIEEDKIDESMMDFVS